MRKGQGDRSSARLWDDTVLDEVNTLMWIVIMRVTVVAGGGPPEMRRAGASSERYTSRNVGRRIQELPMGDPRKPVSRERVRNAATRYSASISECYIPEGRR